MAVPGGISANVGSSAKFCVLVFKASLLWYQGGPLAKEGSSTKFCVLLFKASLLCYPGGALAKVGSSAKFCVLVLKASVLWYQGGPLTKVGSSAKFCVLAFKASLLWYPGAQSAKEGSSAKFELSCCFMLCFYCGTGGSIGQRRFICQVSYTANQGISALLPGGPSAKLGSSAKCCVLVFKASLLWYQGGHQPK